VIFENELELVIEAIKKVLPLKPDALIIQDLGLVRLIRELAPKQVIHASTQMTVTNDLAIEFVNDLNIKRFVLGRENSLSEIKLIKQNTTKELEVFVHGALCVSYSGQCFTSETLGGRSANRGQCAQSCRFEYELIVDGEKKNLVDQKFLVSPQDLCGIAEMPELMQLGVKSFKVEGRLKTPEYVASVASSFRKAISSEVAGQTLNAQQIDQEKTRMAVNYSRGFFPGWLNGVNHQKLVDGTFSSHRGALIGELIDVQSKHLILRLNEGMQVELKNGDGLLWVENSKPEGSFIFSIEKMKHNTFKIGLSKETYLTTQAMGSKVYLNHNKDVKKEIQKSLTDRSQFKKINITIELELSLNQPLKVKVADGKWNVEKKSESVLTRAQKKPLSEELLKDEFLSLSGTVFQAASIQVNFLDERNLFLTHSEIKKCRQAIMAELEDLRKKHQVDFKENEIFLNNFSLSEVRENLKIAETEMTAHDLKINLLLRNKEQVNEIVESLASLANQNLKIDSVCLDFEFGRDYLDSIKKLQALKITTGLATTRILKPQEYQNLKNIFSMNPDFILVRNLGALQYFTKVQKFSGELRGDFSLNVTNQLSANYLLSKGLSSICASYDMNFEQTSALLNHSEASKVEITVHQHMPSFHMEHCVYAAFLSQGSSFKDCGKPCEKHRVQLKDQFGNQHWIKPDHECRNTMYNAQAQTAIQFLNDWKKQGLGAMRYEALHESGLEVLAKLNIYSHYLNQEISLEKALAELQAKESYGLSSGNLAKAQEYQSRKKDHSFLRE
jgi:putative protease